MGVLKIFSGVYKHPPPPWCWSTWVWKQQWTVESCSKHRKNPSFRYFWKIKSGVYIIMKKYSSTLHVTVMSMLAEPNTESPANVDAAKMWREDRSKQTILQWKTANLTLQGSLTALRFFSRSPSLQGSVQEACLCKRKKKPRYGMIHILQLHHQSLH